MQYIYHVCLLRNRTHHSTARSEWLGLCQSRACTRWAAGIFRTRKASNMHAPGSHSWMPHWSCVPMSWVLGPVIQPYSPDVAIGDSRVWGILPLVKPVDGCNVLVEHGLVHYWRQLNIMASEHNGPGAQDGASQGCVPGAVAQPPVQVFVPLCLGQLG